MVIKDDANGEDDYDIASNDYNDDDDIEMTTKLMITTIKKEEIRYHHYTSCSFRMNSSVVS